MLTIDGSQGEGGGQILRTALSLSMITGTPFRIENVRAGRAKPGLLRQHLTCVEAAKRVSNALVTGAEIGARALTFEPGPIRAGTFEFAVGSAGSTALVFQTILPALIKASEPSEILLFGGTHNPFAPTFDYLARVYLPILTRMGASAETRLERHGFFPAGGGLWLTRISPCAQLVPVKIVDPPKVVSRRIHAIVANITFDVAEREVETVRSLLNWSAGTLTTATVKADGPGNVLWVEIETETMCEMFTGFGERTVRAETVAEAVAREVRDYLVAQVPVGPHLADQLLLPMALAGGGELITQAPTAHTRTNVAVIEKFLPVAFELTELGKDRWRIALEE